MAELAAFPEQNDVLKAAPGTESYVNDLPIYRYPPRGEELPEGQMPFVISCFKLSEEELAEVARTGQVYLLALGYTHPPIQVHGCTPFTVAGEQV